MFDGKVENRSNPRELSKTELLQQLDCMKDSNFGKHSSKRKRKRNSKKLN